MGFFNIPFQPFKLSKGMRPKSEQDRIDILVSKCPFISCLCFEQEAEDEVKSAMTEVKFKEHQVIYQAGEPLKYFYVVENGYILIKDANMKGAPMINGPAYSIGHIAILQDEPLNVTITAIDDVTAWAIDAKSFKDILDRWLLRALGKCKKILRNFPLFENLSPGRIGYLAETVLRGKREEGEIFVKKGSSPSSLYFIMKGEVAEQELDDPCQAPIRIYRAGDYFNDMPFLERKESQANFRAITHTEFVEVPRTLFDAVAISEMAFSDEQVLAFVASVKLAKLSP